MHKSSESPPPTSFSSLPEDVALNCLARVPRFYGPTLSLVSRDLRSLIASPELEATRSRIGRREDYLCVCLNLDKYIPEPRWFTLSPIPNQQKLKPMPSFPYQHLESSTVVSTGSEIYIIGGYFEGKRSTRVLVLDCRSHQLRRLPNMRLARESAAADVIDGRIYVIGGSWSDNIDDWGESVVPGRLVMGGKVYIYDDIGYMPELRLDENNVCLVEIDNMMCQVSVCKGILLWYDLKWSWVRGLEGQLNSHFPCYLVSVANYDRGRRVTVWWESVVFGRLGLNWTKECKKEIWCAEISLEIRGSEEIWGFVEWSKNVVTFDGCDSPSDFFLHSAIDGFEWSSVMGVEEVSSIISVANAGGEGRVTVWWKSLILELVSVTEECETKIWCAEISFERRGLTELWGFVDWSKEVFAVDGYDSTYDFFLNSAIVTY
ncbi:F-box domain [Arabidopsis thaliana x Arabidopsis arenosa]|uniref:F-box domain n=1 Tax=Arabidopsis thaliana x Arabidopsis arenosa TaxID=1240361 RepID=A0A8T1YSQ7_9BRAS|nr:F-box domain [Arabidopsis thaliana x Arabidopsis arenosa]